MLEVDALNSPKAREYAQRLWTRLKDADIPFTMHWGKFNSFLNKTRVREMYGDNVDKWIASREALYGESQGPAGVHECVSEVGRTGDVMQGQERMSAQSSFD